MIELLGLPYSTYTERARWALAVRGVRFTFRSYRPLVGEPALRVRLQKLRGPVSVPVLFTAEGRSIADSTNIARWADGQGKGPRLFPAEHEAAIERLLTLANRGMAAGRGLMLPRILSDGAALEALLPRPFRSVLGPLAKPVAAFGVRRVLRKYGVHRASAAEHRRSLGEVLREIRAHLAATPPPTDGGPRTLCGRFTFADIAAAQVLASVEPFLGTGPSVGDPELCASYADLVNWRDDLYVAMR